MEQYKLFLKKCYRQPLPDDDKLLKTASKHFIELAVISTEGITRKQADEFTKKSLHGLTEEILCKKAPIALDHILTPRRDGRPVRCVLVEGAPGIGKSTLAWEVCHKWEELESVKQYELVVLVRLREKKAQEARCLGDLLPCDATTNIDELLTVIGEGKGMLIVCDGFDELPREQRQEGSVYIDLLKGRLLPEATIIVTSRPSVSSDLWSLCQHNIDRHLEVIGFTKKHIEQFAESVFSGDVLAGFLSYITSNPPIHSMMYIPLNAVIVALIYQNTYDVSTTFPKTMTQLFDSLTCGLIRRHLVSTHQVHGEYCMPPSLQCTEDIPSLIYQQFLELAKVAYEGLLDEKYVFTNLGENFVHLGLMKKYTSPDVHGPGYSYSFLHLTLQEYMAALHIVFSGLQLVGWLKERNVVVRFLAGICRCHKYRSHPVYQELVQMLSTKSLQLVHCAYECPRIMDDVKVDYRDEYDTICVEPAVGIDWYVTGYCISTFDKKWGLFIREKEEIDLLVKGLKCSSKGKILFLKLQAKHLFQIISQLTDFCCLRSLVLKNTSDDDDLDDEVSTQPLISLGRTLTRLEYRGRLNTLLFQPALDSVNDSGDTYHDALETWMLPLENTSLKKLIVRRNLLILTSLTFLKINSPREDDLRVLTDIVQSHRTLEELQIGVISYLYASTGDSTNLRLLIEAANKGCLRALTLSKVDYDKLPSYCRKTYRLCDEESNITKSSVTIVFKPWSWI